MKHEHMREHPAFPPNPKSQAQGFTKLEYASIEAMKGLLSNSSLEDLSHEKIALSAVNYAKCLFKEITGGE